MKQIHGTLLLLSLFVGGCASGPSEVAPSVVQQTSAVEPLVVVDREGHRHDLSRQLEAGQPVVLVFWQSWCGSCLKEAPQLAKDSKRWGERLSFYGVVPGPPESVDEGAIDNVLKKFDLPHPQVRDKDLALTRRFHIEGTPTILVLGAGQEVLYRSHELPADWGRWASE